jgi:putative SOS response-associated peptidase YedK
VCGRFGLTRPERLDFARLGVGALPPLAPRYNIAPGSDVLVVRQRKGERRADLVRWGLVPHWATDPSIGNRLINARAESAREKPAFRAAMLARRCLIPADVFYEWQAVAGRRRKRPFAVRLKADEPFALGGLWEYWRPDPSSQGLASCTILTTEPNELLRPIHDRMPVLVPPEQYDAWLDPGTAESAIDALLRPFPAEEMRAWPITLRVNDPDADDETVLVPDAVGGAPA